MKVVLYIGLTLQNNFDFRGGRARQVGVVGLTRKSFAKIAPSQALVDHTVYDDIGVNNLQAKKRAFQCHFTNFLNTTSRSISTFCF